MPLEPKPSTSREVKSGRRNLSFSKLGGHGSRVSISSAPSTKTLNFLDIYWDGWEYESMRGSMRARVGV
jgi:hypothetical protein